MSASPLLRRHEVTASATSEIGRRLLAHFYVRQPLVLSQEHLPEGVSPQTRWVVSNFEQKRHPGDQILTFFLLEAP